MGGLEELKYSTVNQGRMLGPVQKPGRPTTMIHIMISILHSIRKIRFQLDIKNHSDCFDSDVFSLFLLSSTLKNSYLETPYSKCLKIMKDYPLLLKWFLNQMFSCPESTSKTSWRSLSLHIPPSCMIDSGKRRVLDEFGLCGCRGRNKDALVQETVWSWKLGMLNSWILLGKGKSDVHSWPADETPLHLYEKARLPCGRGIDSSLYESRTWTVPITPYKLLFLQSV